MLHYMLCKFYEVLRISSQCSTWPAESLAEGDYDAGIQMRCSERLGQVSIE